ncbi:MAG: hypothetical protein WBL21_09555 [Salinimicrobium sp.]
MKKLILSLSFAVLALTTFSCRESTQDKTKEAAEAIGDDIEAGTREAAQKVEEGAEKVEREIDEEIHDTDDQIAPVEE